MMQRQPRSDATPAMLLGMVEAFSSFGTWCSPSASFGILDMHVDAIVNKNSCLTDRDGLSNTAKSNPGHPHRTWMACSHRR